MNVLPYMEQGSPGWHRWRADGIGGSDIPIILGLKPDWKTRGDLLRLKINGADPTGETFAMRRGTRLEPVCRKLMEAKLGVPLTPVCVEQEAPNQWMKSSLDGSPPDFGFLLEIKAPNYVVHEGYLEGVIPEYYRAQCQWQALVSGVSWGFAASYNDGKRFAPPDQLAYVPFFTDPEYQAHIADEAERFWQEVLAGRAALRS